MEWLAANWFWVVIGIAFIVMHLFGHGGHGNHGEDNLHRRNDKSEKDEGRGRAGEHRH